MLPNGELRVHAGMVAGLFTDQNNLTAHMDYY